MLCDGKCKIEKETEDGVVTKKCGLYRTIVHHNDMTGETKEHDMCVFDAILNSLHRTEQSGIRLQAAVESSRNDNAKRMNELGTVFIQGFNGIIHQAEQSRKLFSSNTRVPLISEVETICED